MAESGHLPMSLSSKENARVPAHFHHRQAIDDKQSARTDVRRKKVQRHSASTVDEPEHHENCYAPLTCAKVDTTSDSEAPKSAN